MKSPKLVALAVSTATLRAAVTPWRQPGKWRVGVTHLPLPAPRGRPRVVGRTKHDTSVQREGGWRGENEPTEWVEKEKSVKREGETTSDGELFSCSNVPCYDCGNDVWVLNMQHCITTKLINSDKLLKNRRLDFRIIPVYRHVKAGLAGLQLCRSVIAGQGKSNRLKDSERN